MEATRPLDRRFLETHRQLHRPLDLPAALRAVARFLVVVGSETKLKYMKTLDVTSQADAQKKVSDIKVVGNTDSFRLLCKASSEDQGWMKSTKAMEIPGGGIIVQVSTQQRATDGSYGVAEALAYVPGVTLAADENNVGCSRIVPV